MAWVGGSRIVSEINEDYVEIQRARGSLEWLYASLSLLKQTGKHETVWREVVRCVWVCVRDC